MQDSQGVTEVVACAEMWLEAGQMVPVIYQMLLFFRRNNDCALLALICR
jgi:hypothetical protein